MFANTFSLNQGPVWTSVPGTNAKVGEVYSYTLRASDAEGDTLSFSATTLPSWLTLQCSGVSGGAVAKGLLGGGGGGVAGVAGEPALLATSSAQWTPLPEVNEARLAEPVYYEGEGWVYPTVNSQVPLAPVAAAEKRHPKSSGRLSVNPLAAEFPDIYLYLTVLDDSGNAVTNLTQNDFYVWEQASGESNAVAEAITSFGETAGGGAGISFSLVFDVSGSMGGTPLTDAKKAAISFLANTAASDRGNLVQFSSYNEVSLVLACDWVTADADHDGSSNLQEAIQSLVSLNNTALYDGAAKGVESLSQEPKPKAVIMFTDGGENDSVTYNANTLVTKANNEGVPVYTIGLGTGAATTLLTSLAAQTGGSYHYAPTAADMAAVYTAIAKEVRSRYVLGYRTHNTNFDGTLRTVTVSARGTTGAGVYRVNSTPQPVLDPATQNLSQQSQPPGLPLVISGTLTDLDAQSGGQPLAGALYYRAAGGSIYSQVALAVASLGNGHYTFSATIPGGSVVYPGLYYYLRFTDGIQEVYLPFNYNTVPSSISVLDNHAPVITHTPLGLAIPGQSLTVTASITESDAGDAVSSAVVYYRVHDARQSTPYKSLTMQRSTGNTFTALIPAVEVTDAGIDYYLSAWDTHAVRADSGTTSSPYYVPARGCRLVGTPTLADVGSHNVALAVSDGLATVPQQFAITVPLVPPKITALPQSQAVLAGSDASFQVTATGSAPLSYQWLWGGQEVAGATSSTLLITNVQLSQAGYYVVVITNLAGAVTSAPPAGLTVGQLPQITAAPASQSVWQGGTVRLGVTATGTAPLSYQWYGNGAAVPGASGPDLTITNAAGSQSGSYWAVVANSWGAATSAVATVTVTTLGDFLNAPGLAWTTRGTAPWIMQTNITHDGVGALRSGAIGEAQESVLEAIVTGPGMLGFWWKVSSEDGSDFLKFSLNGVEQAAIAGEVDWERRTVAVPAGTVTLRWVYAKDLSFQAGADAAWLDQVDFAQVFAPMIRQQPADLVVLTSAAAAFNASVEGTAPLQYQWRLNGQPLSNAGGYSGVTTSNLVIASTQPAHTGNYTLVVTNQAGAATSQVARLALLLTPVFTVWPTDRDVVAGSTVTLTASATSAVPPGYQWRCNGANLLGATNTSLTLTNVQVSAQGLYVVVVSNAAGVTSSPPARLTVWFPPQIEVQPQGQTVVGGGSLTLRVGASGTGPLSYQWRLNSTNLSNGARLSGTTTNTLVISPIVRADAGDYSVIVSNLALAVLSGTARVEVEPLRFQAVRWSTNGQVELRLLGEVGALVKLQTTTNFSQWTTLGTVTNHSGTLDYAFPGTNQPGRYYRAWMP